MELQPEQADAVQLLHLLEEANTVAREVPAPRRADRPLAGPTVPEVEVTSQALGLFTTRVQPILMNTCARCHANGRGGSFKLLRAYSGSLNNLRATQHNIAAVMAQINPDARKPVPCSSRP